MPIMGRRMASFNKYAGLSALGSDAFLRGCEVACMLQARCASISTRSILSRSTLLRMNEISKLRNYLDYFPFSFFHIPATSGNL